jgi:CheY-like chemotaxis protein
MRPTIEDRRIEIDVDLGDGDFRPLRADASRLQQIVWNLLSNAIKFSPEGGRIALALEQDDHGVSLRVTDHGQGIAPGFLPFVFDRFAQSDAAGNRQRGGLGLGLSIVKQLVEAHGGRIAAASDGVGLGASFVVWLPSEPGTQIVDESMPSAFGALDVTESPEASLAGLRLLVVDDDPDANAMLRIILSDRGATVQAASDVDEALRLVDSLRPDALISDIGMPGKDGYDLIREVRRREAAQASEGRPYAKAPHLPAIALTSFAREQDRQQAAAAGFDAHCAKPLRPLNLVQQIRHLLDRRA